MLVGWIPRLQQIVIEADIVDCPDRHVRVGIGGQEHPLRIRRDLSQASKELEDNNANASLILFSMWTETIRHVAEMGKGNVMFLDGTPDGMEKQMKDLVAMQQLNAQKVEPPPPPA